ncbi:MAG: hypothetical protein FWE31_04155 [Firmicutes bacterium]|nr:hypothetical protein [Bacillota bacterium]
MENKLKECVFNAELAEFDQVYARGMLIVKVFIKLQESSGGSITEEQQRLIQALEGLKGSVEDVRDLVQTIEALQPSMNVSESVRKYMGEENFAAYEKASAAAAEVARMDANRAHQLIEPHMETMLSILRLVEMQVRRDSSIADIEI